MDFKKRPLLKGYLRDGSDEMNKVIDVWCPFCGTFHTHGWPYPYDKAPTHRLAHCSNSSSPFKKGGYYIFPFSKKELAAMSKGSVK